MILAAIRVDRAGDERIRRLLEGELDWAALLQEALRQGVVPLIYRRLKEAAADLAPEEELARWKAVYEGNVRRNLRRRSG